MLNKKSFIRVLAIASVILTFGGIQEAKAGHGYGRGCRPVFQTIDLGGFLRYTEYGTVCPGHNGRWDVVYSNPHPRRHGYDLFFVDYGRYHPARNVYFVREEPRYVPPHHWREWRRDHRWHRSDHHDRGDHRDRDWRDDDDDDDDDDDRRHRRRGRD